MAARQAGEIARNVKQITLAGVGVAPGATVTVYKKEEPMENDMRPVPFVIEYR